MIETFTVGERNRDRDRDKRQRQETETSKDRSRNRDRYSNRGRDRNKDRVRDRVVRPCLREKEKETSRKTKTRMDRPFMPSWYTNGSSPTTLSITHVSLSFLMVPMTVRDCSAKTMVHDKRYNAAFIAKFGLSNPEQTLEPSRTTSRVMTMWSAIQ